MTNMGPVEIAVRAVFPKLPAVLHTYGQNTTFVLSRIDAAGIVLLLGAQKTPTALRWACLEGVPAFLHGRGWVSAGGGRTVEGQAGTLDEYLKTCITRDCAHYVAVVLEAARVIKTNRGRPLEVSV